MLRAPVPYDPRWPARFAELADALRAELPLDYQIAHIGSTAVPGLAAKPIIDMQVSVPCLSDFDPAPLARAGFDFAPEITADDPPPGSTGPASDWTKAYARCTQQGRRVAHLHIRQTGRANHRFALLFRDFLRADALAASEYGTLKLALAARTAQASDPGGSGAYLDLKDPYVRLLGRLAETWAVQTGWHAPQA